MTSSPLQWKFPPSPPKKHGFNSSGISHFTGERYSALFRELIQNSLDAHNGEDTVNVDVFLDDVDPKCLGGVFLKRCVYA